MFYVYFYLRYGGTPYYVGKGSGRRVFERHRVSVPKDRTRIIFEYYESEADALEAEKFFISYFGRKDLGTGILRNLTEGGDNAPTRLGQSPTAGVREKIRKTLKGRKLTPEHRRNMSEGMRGRVVSDETRRKISDAQTGKARKTTGSRNGKSKLTEADAAFIRNTYKKGVVTYVELGKLFEVGKVTIGYVLNEGWKYEEVKNRN